MGEGELRMLVERLPTVPGLASAAEDYLRPLRVDIAGRRGVGRSTVAAALELDGAAESAPVDDPDAPDPVLDADAVIYVLAVGVQPADRAAVREVGAGRAIAILNKADAVDDVAHVVAECTALLGIPTVPLIATSATRQSGIEEARAAVGRTVTRAAALRGGRLLDALDRLSARTSGDDRDAIEEFLRSDAAVRIGLEAAWASPGLAAVVGDHDVIAPARADEALRLAEWWRSYADGTTDTPARRAALRIHDGYVRTWSKLVRDGQ